MAHSENERQNENGLLTVHHKKKRGIRANSEMPLRLTIIAMTIVSNPGYCIPESHHYHKAEVCTIIKTKAITAAATSSLFNFESPVAIGEATASAGLGV